MGEIVERVEVQAIRKEVSRTAGPRGRGLHENQGRPQQKRKIRDANKCTRIRYAHANMFLKINP